MPIEQGCVCKNKGSGAGGTHQNSAIRPLPQQLPCIRYIAPFKRQLQRCGHFCAKRRNQHNIGARKLCRRYHRYRQSLTGVYPAADTNDSYLKMNRRSPGGPRQIVGDTEGVENDG